MVKTKCLSNNRIFFFFLTTQSVLNLTKKISLLLSLCTDRGGSFGRGGGGRGRGGSFGRGRGGSFGRGRGSSFGRGGNRGRGGFAIRSE